MTRSRLRLLEPTSWPAEMQKLAEGPIGPVNVMKALMHHPDLFRRWSIFANHFLFKGELPDRAREIAILRVAWLTDCEYEWAQHVVISGKVCGFGPGELRDVQVGASAGRWSVGEKAILRLTDGLVAGPRVSDRTWDHVVANWNEKQTLEAIALVGNYVMLAMALNAVAVPVDPGYDGFGANKLQRPDFVGEAPAPNAPRGGPRLAPLQDHAAGKAVVEMLNKARGEFSTVNVIDTLAHHPDMLRRWLPFFSHCLHKQSLDERQRELVILRTGWLAGSAYEWAQHVPIALRRKVTPEEIECLTEGPENPYWHGADKVLLETVDALMARFTLDNAEWRKLATHVTTPKALDTIFTVGQYRLVAGLLTGANVQLDGYLRFPPPLQ